MKERETMIASASFAAGWDAALDAAREAVAGLKRHVEFPGAPVNYIHPDFFLAAIDALKETNVNTQ